MTVTATIITLLVNSMAAFALSKYQFRGRTAVLALILATLMVPLSVIMVPLYIVVNGLNLFNTLWGVILPTVATPTGVFLLRQYMLTIPDELIEAARMDHASEWKIYWRIVLPLAAPALAVLAIFSVMWRWNDFLWPLIVLSRKELYTLQIGLSAFSGELNVQWHYVLAMTVVTHDPRHRRLRLPAALHHVGHRHDGLEMSRMTVSLRGITKYFGPVDGAARRRPRRRGRRVRRLRRPVRLREVHALRIIAGLEKASAGEIRLDGSAVNDVAAADRGLAMVFQSYALYPHMSVRENLAFGLENTRTPRAEIEARVAEAARMLRSRSF